MFILFLPFYLYFCSDTGDSSGPGGLGQGQRNANSCRSLPQGSFWHLWDPVLAQDQTGVWGFCGPDCFMPVTPNVLSDTRLHALPPATGRIISGGDEEDPDHAGNSGERI